MSARVVCDNLGKQYHQYSQDLPWTFQEAIVRGFHKLRSVDRFWALRHIQIELLPGQALGVIGPNGAGKSTLLRLVGGIGRPDEGSLMVSGRVGALLSLGAGFHSDLTGRENIYINGVICGLRRNEVRRRFEAITDFAELGDNIDKPLRTYSSGMWMRLAFSIAVNIDPDVLLVDEVLAVGDVRFQEKCLARIKVIREQGVAILLVSHDTQVIDQFCDQVIWINSGQMVAQGKAEEITAAYLSAMHRASL